MLGGHVWLGCMDSPFTTQSHTGNHQRVSPIGFLATDAALNTAFGDDGVIYPARQANRMAGFSQRVVICPGRLHDNLQPLTWVRTSECEQEGSNCSCFIGDGIEP